MRVEAVDWDNPGAVALRAAQRVEIAERYGTDDSEPGPAPTAADITAFFVAYTDDGTPVGCGGLRAIDATHGEIKRMFVAPSARGSGVSTAILHRLERFALESGWSRLVLETGTAQPDAIRFYTREGFSPIDRFGYYADSDDSLCFEKALVASAPREPIGEKSNPVRQALRIIRDDGPLPRTAGHRHLPVRGAFGGESPGGTRRVPDWTPASVFSGRRESGNSCRVNQVVGW